jgi:hypothetical protein
MGMHVRAIGVENADDLNPYLVLLVVICEKGLGTPFPFIIAGTFSNGIHISPVGFRLWMDDGIAIYLTGGGLEYLGFDPFGEPQHIDGSHDRGFHGFYGIVLVMDGGGGTGQVVDLIHLHIKRRSHIVPDQFEIGILQQVEDVPFGPGEIVIQAKYLVALLQESFT